MTYNFTTPANGTLITLTLGTPVSGLQPVTQFYGSSGNESGMNAHFALAADQNFQIRANQLDLHAFRIHGGVGLTGGLASELFPTNTTITSTAIDTLLTNLPSWITPSTDRLIWTFGQSPTWIDLTTSGGRTSYCTCAVNAATYVHNTYGFDFTYWEPLNEWDTTALSGANYIALFNSFQTALKGFNAAYKIGGPTTSFYSASTLATFLASCTPDFLCWHNYYPSGNNQLADTYLGWAGGTSFNAVTNASTTASFVLHFANTAGIYPFMLVSGGGISGAARVASLTATTVTLDSGVGGTQTIANGATLTFSFGGYGADCLSARNALVTAGKSATTPIFLGEFNMDFNFGASEEPLQLTIVGAVFHALVLYSSLTSTANVQMSNWYELTQDSTFGIIQGASGSTYTIAPVGYFLSYFNNHMNGTVATSSIGSGATNLRCLATTNGSNFGVMLVNFDDTQNYRVSVVGASAGPYSYYELSAVHPTGVLTSMGSLSGLTIPAMSVVFITKP